LEGVARKFVLSVLLVLAIGAAGAPPAAVGRPGPDVALVQGTADPPAFVEPVSAPVADHFRLPNGEYGPGNRGWEYRTVAGQPVHAVGDGVVAFAGRVAGRGVVSIEHEGMIRSAVTGLSEVFVEAGETVEAGIVVGLANPGLHVGFRRDNTYLDPATLFRLRMTARLVEAPG
jgi:murein DD-endopeptidase MepM/ murein hydrolase activator NlpD